MSPSDPSSEAVPASGVAVVIPAKDEAERITATVTAALGMPGVRSVLVVDDGSSDATSELARAAGAQVVRHPRNRGKAAAMVTGAYAVMERAEAAGEAPYGGLMFIDADLKETASATAVLAGPILAGEADLSIAILPAQKTAGGGRGFVVGLARKGIIELTGWTPTQPLSGMRCMTPEAFHATQPFAPGWGVETAMTIDVLRAGLRVVEVECELQHRVSGAGFKAQMHRAEQYRDVWRALMVRRWRRWRGRL